MIKISRTKIPVERAPLGVNYSEKKINQNYDSFKHEKREIIKNKEKFEIYASSIQLSSNKEREEAAMKGGFIEREKIG